MRDRRTKARFEVKSGTFVGNVTEKVPSGENKDAVRFVKKPHFYPALHTSNSLTSFAF